MNNFLKNLFGIHKNDQETGTLDKTLSLDNELSDDNKLSNDASSSQDAAISWKPTPPRSNDVLNIHYRGLLKDSGAGEIFLHYGFDSWNRSINTVKMDRMADGSFSTTVKAAAAREMNLCFKDNANNWDNNNGNNWSLLLE